MSYLYRRIVTLVKSPHIARCGGKDEMKCGDILCCSGKRKMLDGDKGFSTIVQRELPRRDNAED